MIYESHLALELPRAKEVLALAERKMVGSSYGYDPVSFQYLPGAIRKLTEVGLREVSQVTFPANGRASIISVKQMLGNPTISQSGLPTREIPVHMLLDQIKDIGKGQRTFDQIPSGGRTTIADLDRTDDCCVP